MGRMAKVDVLIPAYNAAKYLPACIESVLSQTFEDWRIMLVDDGSTDNTPDVVAPYIQSHGTKIRYIRQENRGLPAARNAGIRASDSELLALLDADDLWLPCRLEESVKMLAERPAAGLSYGLVTRIGPDGRKNSAWAGNEKHVEGRIAPQIYMRKVDMICPTITFRRECIDKVGLFDETMRATEDRDMWLRIALHYEVAFIPKILAYYRISPDSMSADSERMLRAQLQFIRKHYGSEGCGFLARQVALARAYKQRAEALKAKGRSRTALASALRAVALCPFDLDNPRTAGSLLVNWLRSP